MFRNSKYLRVQIIENYRYIRLLVRFGMNYFSVNMKVIIIIENIFF